jgi:hypothetical protein
MMPPTGGKIVPCSLKKWSQRTPSRKYLGRLLARADEVMNDEAAPVHPVSYSKEVVPRKASLTLDDVGYSDPLPDDEHIPVVRIDADLDPMVVGGAESFKPGQVFDRRTDRRSPSWLPWKVPEPLWLPPEGAYDEG